MRGIVDPKVIVTATVRVVTLQSCGSPACGNTELVSEVHANIILVRETDRPSNYFEIFTMLWKILPDMRELCEVERLVQGEESNVVLNLPPASSYEEPRVFK